MRKKNRYKKKFIYKINILYNIFNKKSIYLLIVIILAGGFAFYSKLFDVKYINIISNQDFSLQNNTQTEIYKYIENNKFKKNFFGISKINIFTINKKELANSLKQTNKYIENIKIERHLPNKLKIKITEKEKRVVLNLNDNFYLFDKDAEIIDIKKENLFSSLPLILMSTTTPTTTIDSLNIDKKTIDFIHNWHSKMVKLIADVYIDKYIYYPNIKEIDAVTNKGWKIMIDLNSNLDIQITNFIRTYKEKLSIDEKKSLKYIDVRVENYIYYK